MTRTRQLTLGPLTGSYTQSGVTKTKSSWQHLKVCIDTSTSPTLDHDLVITQSPGYWLLAVSGSNGSYYYNNYPLTSISIPGPSEAPSPPSVSTFDMNDVLARMIPGKHSVNLPLFIVELRELGELANALGKLPHDLMMVGKVITNPSYRKSFCKLARKSLSGLSNDLSDKFLTWNFGIAPLLRDLSAMSDLANQTSKMMYDLQFLHSSYGQRRGLSRSCSLPDFASEGQLLANRSLNTALGLPIKATIQQTLSAKHWVSARWKPSDEFINRWSNLDHTGREHESIKRVLGLEPAQLSKVIWEALPWSWLVDWFANAGSYLQATNDSIAHYPNSVCAMQTIERSIRFSNFVGPTTVHFSVPAWHKTEKFRKVIGTPSVLTVTFRPLLSTKKWSILGALSIRNGWLRNVFNNFYR